MALVHQSIPKLSHLAVNLRRRLHTPKFLVDVTLKDVLSRKIPKEKARINAFRQEYGHVKLGDTTVETMYGGMSDIAGLISETSMLDVDEGIRFRGYTIPECQRLLPKAVCGGEQPLPEGLFWLLVAGEMPTQAQTRQLSQEWARRASLPQHVVTMLNNMPKTLHPMSQLSCAMIALNHNSKFAKAFRRGVERNTFWEYTYEDAMDLLAKLPVIAATIYANTYHEGKRAITIDPQLDWAANFARMLVYDDIPDFTELLRLYLTIHSDHEGGSLSTHATSLVGSALSDPFLAYAAGLNSLAGPLHGMAQQEVLEWLHRLQQEIGQNPSDEALVEYVQNTLKAKKFIPGYGHVLLRKTDPRFVAQREFALKHLSDDAGVQLVSRLYKIVPPMLAETCKLSNPWPTVDAHSGVLLYAYGMKEINYYTVLFGVARAIGVLATLIWDRAMLRPLEQPDSMSTNKMMRLVRRKQQQTQAK